MNIQNFIIKNSELEMNQLIEKAIKTKLDELAEILGAGPDCPANCICAWDKNGSCKDCWLNYLQTAEREANERKLLL